MTASRRATLLAAALAAAGLVLLGWIGFDHWQHGIDAPERTTAESVLNANHDLARAVSTPVDTDPVSSREAASVTPVSRPEPESAVKYEPSHVRLVCHAIDANDVPFPAFRALLARESNPAEEVQAKDGAATFSGLVPGQYTLHVQVVGYRNHRETLDLSLANPRVEKTVRLELDEQRVLVKLVTPEGKPLLDATSWRTHQRLIGGPIRVVVSERPLDSGARVSELEGEAFVEENVLRLGRPILDSNHRPVPSEYDGYLRVKLPRPFYASLTIADTVATCLPVDRGSKDLTFVVNFADLASRLARVKLRIIDEATKLPVPKARVSLHKFTLIAEPADGYLNTDDHGEASFENVPLGQVLLQAFSKTGAAEPRFLETRAGESLDLGDVFVKPFVGVKVEGRVLDADGNAVDASVELTAETEMRPGRGSGYGHHFGATEEGAFQFLRVPPGKYTVKAVPLAMQYSPVAKEITVSSSGLQDIILTTALGQRVNIHLDDARPNPSYVVVKNDTNQCLVQVLLGRDALRLTGNLAPGNYTIEPHNASGQAPSIPFTVGQVPVDLTIR